MRKTIRNDLILICSLLVVIVASLLAVFFTQKRKNLVAKIYVKNELVETIDLDKSEDKEFKILGANGELTISIKNHSIAVSESNCPHQDCVHVGYVNETNRPIICAYNQVYIVIEGSSNYDITI